MYVSLARTRDVSWVASALGTVVFTSPWQPDFCTLNILRVVNCKAMAEPQSATERGGELSDFDKYFTVFAGSSEEDVVFAKIFWSSVALHPPLESRLVSADIRQRLRVAQGPATQPQKNFAHEIPTIDIKTAQLLLEAHRKQKTEEKSRYLEKATKRDKIIALLKKQREERIKKELISIPYKPKIAVQDPCRQARKEYEDEALETMKALKEFD